LAGAAGTGFYQGDCQTCPAYTGTTYVNADPTIGLDNQCCGTTQTQGFGGPCLTIREALAIKKTSAVQVTGDSQNNVSALETWPIHLGGGAALSSSGMVCLPGATGKNVINVDIDGTAVSLNGSFVLGSDCQGNPSGAVDGVHVVSGSLAMSAQVQSVGGDGLYVGPGATASGSIGVKQAVNGVHIDGGTLTATVTVDTVSGDGLLCRSDTLPSQPSTVSLDGLTIAGAAKHDVLASTGCVLQRDAASTYLTMQLGDAYPCPSVKRDSYGLYIDSNANVNLDPYQLTISCIDRDGVSVRKSTAQPNNSPTVNLHPYYLNPTYLTIKHCGCAGVYAETGSVSVVDATLFDNHWGLIQQSDLSSTDPTKAILTATANTLACNSSAEPGACCVAGNCPPGGDIFNHSGLPLNASGGSWDQSPIPVCNCNSMVQSCVCTGGQTSPPDGIGVLNAPLSSGTPTTDVSSFTKLTSFNCAQ
jgi:hypothetical protein